MKNQLVGTWQVVSLKTTSEDKVSYPLGEKPGGFVTMTPSRIWLLFTDPGRKQPTSPTLTEAEAAAAMRTHVSWTGKYTTEETPDGLKLTSPVDAASSQALDGTDRVYFVRIDRDRLFMKSPAVIVPMTGKVSVVEIELVKSE
jgi:hypothetical protein